VRVATVAMDSVMGDVEENLDRIIMNLPGASVGRGLAGRR